MIDERKKLSKQAPPAPTANVVGPCPTLVQISRTPRHCKFTQHHRTTRPPSTTELSKLLTTSTSCLTTIKNYVINIVENVYERSGKNLFWLSNSSCEVLNELKSRCFRASSLSTYNFSTLYTTLPHNLIKDKLVDFIERMSKGKVGWLVVCIGFNGPLRPGGGRVVRWCWVNFKCRGVP